MNIGEIGVVKAGTENPYKGGTIMGAERSEALGRFLKGEEVPEYDFWCMPGDGGAYLIQDAEEANVDQETIDFYWGEKKG